MAWTAELDRQHKIVPTGKRDPLTGREKVVRVTTITVFLMSERYGLAFRVGRGKNGMPVFTDEREAATGAAGLTHRGPCPGEQYTKPGPVRKLTPTAWVAEVSRLIGQQRAQEIVHEIG